MLTLGLSAPSRWNPLFRRWARRRAEENMAAALRALVARHGIEDEAAGTYTLVVEPDEVASSLRYTGTIASAADGALRLRVQLGEPPHRPRLLWGPQWDGITRAALDEEHRG